MKKNLVLHATPTAQWQSLVQEACSQSAISLNEELESYLVFLLMRFTRDPNVIHQILATDFLKNIDASTTANRVELQDVGDKCLLFSGLFPGNAKRKRLRISYYVDLGKTAYHSLHTTLFEDLSYHFVSLMDILQSIRTNPLDLIEAQELWSDTYSQRALSILQSHTHGFLVPENLKKH